VYPLESSLPLAMLFFLGDVAVAAGYARLSLLSGS
jgi:hypothetical protein